VGVSVFVEQDVRGLHVAVGEADGVQRGQGFADVASDDQRPREALAGGGRPVRERRATGHPAQGQEGAGWLAAGGGEPPRVDELGEARRERQRGRLGLPRERRAELHGVGQLQRHGLPEARWRAFSTSAEPPRSDRLEVPEQGPPLPTKMSVPWGCSPLE
jgi:hypothetical protein